MNESSDFDPAVQPSITPRFDSVTVGTWCAVLAAFGYTASIIALRHLAKHEGLDWAIWVSCMKAVPVSLTAAAIILYRKSRGRLAWPSARIVLELLATGLFMQFFANVTFQWALSLGGMALSVSLSNAALMLTGVLVQRLLRCTDGAEYGLYSRRIPHFSGIKPKHLLENVMPSYSRQISSVGAPTQIRR